MKTYQVKAKYYYYADTCNAPKDGVVESGFATKGAAEEFIRNQCSGERYCLSNGEYSAPDFCIEEED